MCYQRVKSGHIETRLEEQSAEKDRISESTFLSLDVNDKKIELSKNSTFPELVTTVDSFIEQLSLSHDLALTLKLRIFFEIQKCRPELETDELIDSLLSVYEENILNRQSDN